MESSILPLILHYGVPLVALMLFAGEIGIPTGIPMEITLLLAGAYAVHSLPELLFGLALVTVADLSGTTLLHLVARTGGVRLLTRLLHRHAAQPTGGVGLPPRRRKSTILRERSRSRGSLRPAGPAPRVRPGP